MHAKRVRVVAGDGKGGLLGSLPGLVKSERGKLVLAAVLLLVAGGMLYRHTWGSQGPDLKRIRFVCVASGRTYLIDRAKIQEVPAASPDTGEKTLVPCVVRDGKLYVDGHFAGVLEPLAAVNRCVDAKTLEVHPPAPGDR